MQVHWLQHVAFEGLGSIADWAQARGHTLVPVRLWAGAELPPPAVIELLVVMGGPMSVGDEAEFPWLRVEKQFLRAVIAAGRPVLGICLGAQLLADVLGAPVTRNPHKEIGWFPVHRVGPAAGWPWPESTLAFHWHGDTFGIPPGARHLAASAACAHQAFLYDNRVLGLQFHLETTAASARDLLDHCAHELVPGPCIQDRQAILAGIPQAAACNQLLASLLDTLTQGSPPCGSNKNTRTSCKTSSKPSSPSTTNTPT